MKTNIKALLLTAGVIFGFASCEKPTVLDPLEGSWTAPTEITMTDLTASQVVREGNLRYFTVNVAAGNDNLAVTFVGDKYFLPANTYSPAAKAAAKAGNYVKESTTVNGKAVESGSIVVAQAGNTYTFDAMLFCADGTPYRVKWAGDLVYEADPEPVVLTKLLSTQNNVASGTNSVTINMGTADVVAKFNSDYNSWEFTGGGNYLALDIYSADGFLHEGTYTASAAGGAIGEGQFGIGWDPGDLWNIGMVFENWGTCLWTVSGSGNTAQKITEGTITVDYDEATEAWTIELKAGEGKNMVWAKFTGAIEDLTAGGAVKLTQLVSGQSNLANNTKSLTLNMATDVSKVVATFDAKKWAYAYSGKGNCLSLDIYSEDGKLYTGEYKANTIGGVIGAGEFGIGYDADFGPWGVFENWGTCWRTVDEGQMDVQKILDGTVTVALDGSTLLITLESGDLVAEFTYSAKDFTKTTQLEVVDTAAEEE